MATAPIHASPAATSSAGCPECSARLAVDQRYCVECGARRGPLPRRIAELIGPVLPRSAVGDDPVRAALRPGSGGLATPAPTIVAFALVGLLAFGVLLGSAVTPLGQTQAAAPLVVVVSTPPPSAVPTPVAAPPAPPPTPTPRSAPAAPAPTSTRVRTTAKPAPAPAAAPVTPTSRVLPPVRHVFLVVLSGHGYAAAFGPGSPARYLTGTLVPKGELISNYYAVASGSLANTIAMISGQGPTPETEANCPRYADLTPGTLGDQQQILGTGCVYPNSTPTLPGELTAVKMTWRAYVEDIGAGGAAQPATCRHPVLGYGDPNQSPRPGDAYVTWRNPFVYFHSLAHRAACAKHDVGLDRLAPDLARASSAPSLAYIVPNRCHDGAEDPCVPGQPSGLAAADAFLAQVVPEITGSPAYKDGGLLMITFDQAPQTGPGTDSSACCTTPAYPNLPAAGAPAAAPAAPGSATTTPAPDAATTTPAPDAATTTPAPDTATTTPAPAPPATTPAPTPPAPDAGGTVATGGGGRVGLLLISPYVQPGSVDFSSFNHYSLLRSIEDLFGVPPTGYAATVGLTAFDKAVYNAYQTKSPFG